MGYGPTPNAGASPDHKGDSIIVMITNACPKTGNEEWCTAPNQFGYGAHFDIASVGNPNGWGNVVVQYEKTDCGAAKGLAGSKLQGDLLENYAQCKCAAQKKPAVRRDGRALQIKGREFWE